MKIDGESRAARLDKGDARITAAIFFGILLISLLGMIALTSVSDPPQWDGIVYRKTALHLRSFVEAPFSFRILTPFIAHSIPLTVRSSFVAINAIGLAASGALLYLFARTFMPRNRAMLSAVYFILTGGFWWIVLDPWLIDGMTYALAISALLLARYRLYVFAGLVAALGVANHESLLFIAGVVLLQYLQEPQRSAKIAAAIIGPPILVYVAFRYSPLLFESVSHSNPYFSRSYVKSIWRARAALDGGYGFAIFAAAATSFGGLWVLAAASFRRSSRDLKLLAVLLIPLMVSCIFITDWERVLMLAYPVIVTLACLVRPRPAPLVAFLGAQSLTVFLGIARIASWYDPPHRHLVGLTVMALSASVLSAWAMTRGARASTEVRWEGGKGDGVQPGELRR